MYSGEKNNSIAFASICNEQLMKATALDIFKEPWFMDLPKDTQHLILYNLGRQSKKSNDASEMFKEPWFENLPQKTQCLIIFTLGSNNEGQKTATEKHVTEGIAGAEHSIAEEFPIAEKNLEEITGAEHSIAKVFPDEEAVTENHYEKAETTQLFNSEIQYDNGDKSLYTECLELREAALSNKQPSTLTDHVAAKDNGTGAADVEFVDSAVFADNLDGSETSFIGSNLDSFEHSVRVLDNPESINNWKNLYYSDSSEDEEELQQDDQKQSNISLRSLANSSNSETSMQYKFKKFNRPNKKRATTTRPKRATENHYEISDDGSDFCDETSEKGNGERVSAFMSNPYGKKTTIFGTIVNQVSIS